MTNLRSLPSWQGGFLVSFGELIQPPEWGFSQLTQLTQLLEWVKSADDTSEVITKLARGVLVSFGQLIQLL